MTRTGSGVGLLGLSRTWTPEQAAAKIGADWGRPTEQHEDWETNRGTFWTALYQAVEAGLVEVRRVQRAQHATTGEVRTFYSTDADCPAKFSCMGMAASARAPWYALSSHAEWRCTPATQAVAA